LTRDGLEVSHQVDTRPAGFTKVSVAGDDRLATREKGRALSTSITVAISPGELLDKISILEIKSQRIGDPEKLRNVQSELDMLRQARDLSIPGDAELAELTNELRLVNEILWDVEDAIRSCERNGDFGPDFIALARSVYKSNDRRAALKKQINERLSSPLLEEKSYALPPRSN
jgi:hypothetical protein